MSQLEENNVTRRADGGLAGSLEQSGWQNKTNKSCAPETARIQPIVDSMLNCGMRRTDRPITHQEIYLALESLWKNKTAQHNSSKINSYIEIDRT
jgi:hypothetical protein